MIHKIKALYDEGRGLGIRAIARQLGLSRNTVKKSLRMDEAAIAHQQSDRGRRQRLDDYRVYWVHLLTTFPELSTVKVLRKLREKHPELVMSERTVRRYLRRLKETVAVKPRRHYEAVLDLVPGVQCQVDGGELRGVWVGGVEQVVYFVVFVLSYSRLMYVALSPTPVDTETFIGMHDAAFRYFGGGPEECVYDQAKLVVLHEPYRELELNPRFHAYATAVGFRIHACEGYDPESKGKVEAGVKYVKHNALYGETLADWDHLQQHLAQWLDEIANVRIHGTTGEPPRPRDERDERRHMRAYLTPAYLAQERLAQETRPVDKMGLLSWKANKYSAPLAYQGARVGVREAGGQLVLGDLETGQEIARHDLRRGQGEVIKNTDHDRDKGERIADLEAAIRHQLGAEPGSTLCGLLKQTNPRIYKDQLVGLNALLKRYGMPPVRLARLGDRRALTTRQIRDYLDAYAAHPERLNHDLGAPGQPPPLGSESSGLIRYAGIARPRQEVDHDHHH